MQRWRRKINIAKLDTHEGGFKNHIERGWVESMSDKKKMKI